MEDEHLRNTLIDIWGQYRKGAPPKISEYQRKRGGSVYLSEDELKALVDAKMIELLDFNGYQRVRITEKGKDVINSKKPERYG